MTSFSHTLPIKAVNGGSQQRSRMANWFGPFSWASSCTSTIRESLMSLIESLVGDDSPKGAFVAYGTE